MAEKCFSPVMIFQKAASYPFSVSHDEPPPIRADYVLSDIDVNGDSKIGMAEVIYILTKNSGAEMIPIRFQRPVFSDRKTPGLKTDSNRSDRLKSGSTENTVSDSELV